jgi:hypothetical protein
MTMREVTWDLGNGIKLKGIEFPCNNPKCHGEVKVDENHPNFEALKANPTTAMCNQCLKDHIFDLPVGSRGN